MPGSPMQNKMFDKTGKGMFKDVTLFLYLVVDVEEIWVHRCIKKNFDVKSEKKKNKRNWKSTEPRKTTKGKGRNFRTVEEGAGMTSKRCC